MDTESTYYSINKADSIEIVVHNFDSKAVKYLESLRAQRSDLIDSVTYSHTRNLVVLTLKQDIAVFSHDNAVSEHSAISSLVQCVSDARDYLAARINDSIPLTIPIVKNNTVTLIFIPTNIQANRSPTLFFIALYKLFLTTMEFLTPFTSIWTALNTYEQSNQSFIDAERFALRAKAVYGILGKYAADVIPLDYSESDALFTGLLVERRQQLQKLIECAKDQSLDYVIRLHCADTYEYNLIVNNFVIPALNADGISSTSDYVAAHVHNHAVLFLPYTHNIDFAKNYTFKNKHHVLVIPSLSVYEFNDFSAYVNQTNGDINRITKTIDLEFPILNDEAVRSICGGLQLRSGLNSKGSTPFLNVKCNGAYSELNVVMSSLLQQEMISLNKSKQCFELLVFEPSLTPEAVLKCSVSRDELSVLRVLSLSITTLSEMEINFALSELSVIFEKSRSLSNILERLCSRGIITSTYTGYEVISKSFRTSIAGSISSRERHNFLKALESATSTSRAVDNYYYQIATCGKVLPSLLVKITVALDANPHTPATGALIEETLKRVTSSDLIKSPEGIRFINSAATYFKSKCDLEQLLFIYERVEESYKSDPLKYTSVVECYIYTLKRVQEYSKAISVGVSYLDKLDVIVPLEPTLYQVLIKYLKARTLLRGKLNTAYSLQECSDNRIRSANRILSEISGAVYMERPLLFPYLAALSVELYSKYGSTPEVSFGLAGHAFFCREAGKRIPFIGSDDEAEKILRLANAISQQFKEVYDCRIKLVEYGLVRNWRIDQLQSIRILFESYQKYSQTDPEFSLYTAAIGACLCITRGTPLEEIRSKIDVPLYQAKAFNQKSSFIILSVISQFIELCTKGVISTRNDDVPNLDENQEIELSIDDQTVCAVFYTLKASLLVLEREYSKSLVFIRKAKQYEYGVQGQQLTVLIRFLHAWAMLNSGEIDKKVLRSYSCSFKSWQKDSALNARIYVNALESMQEPQIDKRIDLLKKAYHICKEQNNHFIASLIADAILLNAKDIQRSSDESFSTEAIISLEIWGGHFKANMLRKRVNDTGHPINFKARNKAYLNLANALEYNLDQAAVLNEISDSIRSISGITSVSLVEADLSRRKLYISDLRAEENISHICELKANDDILGLAESEEGYVNTLSGLYVLIDSNQYAVKAIKVESTEPILEDLPVIKMSARILKLRQKWVVLKNENESNKSLITRIQEDIEPNDQNIRFKQVNISISNQLIQTTDEILKLVSLVGQANSPLKISIEASVDHVRAIMQKTFRHINEITTMQKRNVLLISDAPKRLDVDVSIIRAAGHTYSMLDVCFLTKDDFQQHKPDIVVVDVESVATHREIENLLVSKVSQASIVLVEQPWFGAGYRNVSYTDTVVPKGSTLIDILISVRQLSVKPRLRSVTNQLY